MTTRRKKLLFQFRTKMVKVGHNYGKETKCPLCKLDNDTQEHIFDCIIMKIQCSDLFNSQGEKYEDIFSLNDTKLENIAKLCESIS